jgi:hypothetical protein
MNTVLLALLLASMFFLSGCTLPEPLPEQPPEPSQGVLTEEPDIVDGILQIDTLEGETGWVMTPADPQPGVNAGKLDLGTTWKLTLSPVVLGVVKEGETNGRIEVEVESFVPGERMTVSYSIQSSDGTIDGSLNATGLKDSYHISPPYFWPEGTGESETSLIWYCLDGFQELREDVDSVVELDFRGERPDWYQERWELIDADLEIPILRSQREPVFFELEVNGVKSQVQTLHATDGFSNHYLILDNFDNPLILKFWYEPIMIQSTLPFGSLASLQEYTGWQVTSIET